MRPVKLLAFFEKMAPGDSPNMVYTSLKKALFENAHKCANLRRYLVIWKERESMIFFSFGKKGEFNHTQLYDTRCNLRFREMILL